MNYYDYVTTALYWDMDTNMPDKGFERNADTSTFFATEGFKMQTAPELKEMLEGLLRPEEFDALDDNWKFIVKRMKRSYDENERVPVDFYSEYMQNRSESERAWQDAKRANDFSIFAPYLEKTIEYEKKMVGYTHPGKEVYDAMLDMYEEGMNSATIDRIFEELKKDLIPLVRAITSKPHAPNPKFGRRYSLESQRACQKLLLEYIGFDFEKGAVGETEHPFTINFSCNDVRVSNHFREENVIDPMFSAIHEGGHAIFEMNVAPELDGTVGGSCSYMGIHESQSRFYENILGRNINFWIPVYDKVQKLIPELKDVSVEEFYAEINRVEAGLIRTMSDEVTYGLHIIIRYEMEKAIIRDNVPVDELPALWNKKMEEYLGITPDCDADGILQDMHWSDGSFGYFPSYLLGSIYDGMYLDELEKELGPVDDILRSGRILDITHWLNEKIHKYGSTRLPAEVIADVCHREVSAEPLMRYFRNKYSKLYDI